MYWSKILKHLQHSTIAVNNGYMDRLKFCHYEVGGETAVLPKDSAVLLHPSIIEIIQLNHAKKEHRP
jgi:hypothetical protein